MALAVRQRNKEISPKMKKLMSIMLAMALTIGLATVTLAQDDKDKKSATKKKGGKKGGDKGDKGGDKGGKSGKSGKGGKKGKDGDTK